MLEGIVAFQRYRLPVWNEASTFEERIARLPLYALEFNHPDRDSNSHGPTIAHYAPDRREVIALAEIIRSIGTDPRILDIGCGNGFIGSLLAREGLSVTGIDDHSWRRPQIPCLYDQQMYELRAPVSLWEFRDKFTVAFCSWMVPGSNLTSTLIARDPALIIHVYSPSPGHGGMRETGTNDAYCLPDKYRRLGSWAACTPENFFSDIVPALQKKDSTVRIVEMWCREDVEDVRFFAPTESENSDPYYWDFERSKLNEIRRERGLACFEIRTAPALQIPSLFPHPLT